jgi:uncharacterized protein (DUF952 family)
VIIFHIVDRAAWIGTDYAPPSLTDEGFVHFSFADQVEPSANRYYRDREGLCVVEVDSASIPGELRIENGFPHVYGPIPIASTRTIHELTRAPNGDYRFTRPAAGASTDR